MIGRDSAPEQPAARERVLVVEGARELAASLGELIARTGAVPVLCLDAASAERESQQGGFDLAIVDIELAGPLNGLALLPRLRRASAHAELVLMTGNATLHSAIEAIHNGVYAYIIKPFEPEQVLVLVKRALAQVALQRDKHALTQRVLASEALYRGMVENSDACVLGLDDQALIRLASRSTSERLGLSPAQLLGTPFASLCQPALEEPVARALAGETVRDHQCVHETPGGPRTLRWTLRPLAAVAPDLRRLQQDDERAVRLLATGLDITDRLELLRKTAEAEAMAAMGTLTTSLAHEIRNPLNAAVLQLELLSRRIKKGGQGPLQQQLAEPAALARSELSRLTALLDDFLNLARPRGLALQPCKLAELTSAVCALKAPLAQSLGIELRNTVADTALTVQADPDRLKQVLINLVTNALEALSEAPRPAGWVELSAVASGAGVLIAVRDNGPGLPPEIAEDAFKPFVTTKQAGTGLGLAIVHTIISQHGGDVRLVARPGGGTSAELILPS